MNEKYDRVFKAAVELFDNNEEKAQRWMSSPLKPLEWKTPRETLNLLNGEQTVLQLILRIEHSVYF
jgi:uncharacterized protein (DUF2384 family)